jgi:hypothetical protein
VSGSVGARRLPGLVSAQPVGSEFQVNTYTTGIRETSIYGGRRSVAADSTVNSVVVWQGWGLGDGLGVFGRRYDSAGDTLGMEFRVNSFTTSNQSKLSVAADAAGNFVVVWDSGGQENLRAALQQRR